MKYRGIQLGGQLSKLTTAFLLQRFFERYYEENREKGQRMAKSTHFIDKRGNT